MVQFLSVVLKAVLPFGLSIAVILALYTRLGGPAFTFWLSAAAAVIPGLFIIVSKDIVRTAFWLLCSLSGFAGFYVLLGADFLAITQIMVYLGGIMILILFGVMLTSKDPLLTKRVRRLNNVMPGLAAAAVILVGLIAALQRLHFAEKGSGVDLTAVTQLPRPTGSTVEVIGERLLTDFVLPFEMASILLLAALVGAAYVARRGQPQEA